MNLGGSRRIWCVVFLEDLFRKHGNVIRVEMPMDADTGESRGSQAESIRVKRLKS